MKINHIYAYTLLSILIFSSCNSGDKSKSGSFGSGLFSSKDDKKEAGEVIAFYNSLVKVDEAQNNNLRTFTRNLDQFDDYVKNKVTNPDAFIATAPVMILPPVIHTMQQIVYPDGYSKEYKPMVDKMTETFDAIQSINKEISVYKTAEDWREDKGQKLGEFREKAIAEIKKNRDVSDEIFNKLKPIVEKAEETTLKDNPLKDQYVRSKKLLNLVQSTNIMAFETEDLAKLKTDFKKNYQEIEKVYNENKKDELPKEYQNQVRSFNLFNDSVNDFLGKMRVVQRDLDASKEPDETTLSSLDNGSQNVLRSFNSFVD